MKKYFGFLVLAFYAILFFPNNPLSSFASESELSKPNYHSIRAISLREFQAQLKTCQKRNACSEELLYLSGINRIMGYINDEISQDIIIFGHTGKNLPALHTDDFVLALRNAWLKYAPLRGNTYEYSFPGCSIDPNPRTIQKLQQIGQNIARASFDQIQDQLKFWHQACKEAQQVRVMGIPFHTRFARVMVEADYEMKLFVDGTTTSTIPGLANLVDMKLAKIKYALEQNQPITISLASMDRFWFHPGENIYEEDENIVLINQCPVHLLTEEMFLNAGGNFAGGNRTDPLAQTFAENFSALYDKVAEDSPIYAELENLFRFFALAQVIKFKSAENQADIYLDFLLNGYTIKSTPVEKNLPGRSAVKEFQKRKELQDGYQIAQLWLPSCGGVNVGIQAGKEQFNKNSNGLLAALKNKILNARPSQQTAQWDVAETSDGLVSKLDESIRISKTNYQNKNISTLSAHFNEANGNYELFCGKNDPIISTTHPLNLFNEITKQMTFSRGNQVFIILSETMPANKKEALKSTFNIKAMNQKNTRVEIIDTNQILLDKIYSPGEFQLTKAESDITRVTQGRLQNWYKFTVNFVTRVAGKFCRLVVEIYARTLEIAKQLLQQIKALLAPHYPEPVSLPEKINEILKRMEKSHNLKREDVKVKIRDEFDEMEFGDVLTSLDRCTV